jgi:MFS family permease
MAQPLSLQAGFVGIAFAAALRLVQGVALGADLAGPAIHLAERAPLQLGLHAAAVPATAALGALAAAVVCLFVTWVLGAAALAAWGWRVPLVAGLAVEGASLALRLLVLRDPEEGLGAAELADRRGVGLAHVLRCGGRQQVLFGGARAPRGYGSRSADACDGRSGCSRDACADAMTHQTLLSPPTAPPAPPPGASAGWSGPASWQWLRWPPSRQPPST